MSSIQSIIIRPEKKLPSLHVESAEITPNGITGDHHHKPEGKRTVTIISGDALATIAANIGFHGDAHLASRRNIMIDSLPEEDLNGKVIQLGDDVILEITGYCSPCIRMDENFGEGAMQAFEKKGGWTARVIEGGAIYVGDRFIVR